MPRLFIGITLPDSCKKRLGPLTDELAALTRASVNWSKPRTWHLTLKFLGETEEARIPAIREALSVIDFPAFTLHPGGAGAFPDAKRPKVLWLGLAQGGERSAALAEAVEDALSSIGIPREKKSFRPHLTLGRVRNPAPGDWRTVLDRTAATDWPSFTADKFILWQSTLAPTGATHTPLAEFPLK